MGWPTGWLLDASTGTPTDLNLTVAPASAVYGNNIIAGNSTQLNYTANASAPTGWTAADFVNYINGSSLANILLSTAAEVQLGAPFQYGNSVDFNPQSASPALAGADFTNTKLQTWFTPVSYRGACASGDAWRKGWTMFR